LLIIHIRRVSYLEQVYLSEIPTNEITAMLSYDHRKETDNVQAGFEVLTDVVISSEI
jgi:hypothetical protein